MPDQDMDRLINDAIIRGDEYLPTGRRNFFSPVTQYKVAKSKFYTDAEGNSYAQKAVPIEKWEVELLCDQSSYNADRVWQHTVKSKPKSVFLEKYGEMGENKKKEIIKERIEKECKPEEIPDMSFNYCNSIFGSTISDVLQDHDFEEDDITINNLIVSELQIVDDIEEKSFRRADLLEEIIKLDTVNDDTNSLLKTTQDRFFPEFNSTINEHIRRLEINKDKVDPVKQSISDNIRFLKYMNNHRIAKYKKFDYSDTELKLKSELSLSNVYKHLEILIKNCETDNWKEADFDKFEKSTFIFLNTEYQINRRQKVVLIPSGGGKTTLFSKYYKYLVDIDYLRVLNADEEFFSFIMEYSKIFGRWNVINKYWQFILWKFQKFYGDRILLCHSIHQLPFFMQGLELMALIPRKKDDYNVRFFRQNSDSIRSETKNIFEDQQDLSFLRIYEYFYMHGNEIIDEHYQYFKGRKVISNGEKLEKLKFSYI